MPELYRSLLVVLVIAGGVFWTARMPVLVMGTTPQMFALRRNVWFGITLAAFLSNNFWIFVLVSSMLLLYGRNNDDNQLALFFALLFAVPLFKAEVPGLGIVNYLFDLTYYRLLSLLILFPAYLVLRQQKGVDAFGKYLPDKFLAAYVLLGLGLQLPVDTLTNTLRTAFELFLDVFLPYYVASRYIKNIQQFRDALIAFVLAALMVGLVGVFEFAKGWLLFSQLSSALGVEWGLGRYLNRGESLRAIATTGQPIVHGYVMAVALGVYLFIGDELPSRSLRVFGALVLAAGLLSSLSRGPWIGAGVGYFVFVLTGLRPAVQIAKTALLLLVVMLLAMATPFGEKIIDHLPFVGAVDNENVVYRERLLANASIVIMRNPYFGTFDFFMAPEMEELRSGGDDGIIDLVNSYLTIALRSGVIGLVLFVGFFFTIILSTLRAVRLVSKWHPNLYLLGRVLLAVLLGILVMIYTVSSITHIPIIYWIFGGLCICYVRLVSQVKS